ncbi:uncharacterized protein BDZ99DRAFT_203 [Mytilinidion resinicola]|uniref:Uncharacterized protein n=1 Tax=Mytilinidion resinicola TaxID=574789 RepID=A0A6A6Z7Q2_9PEZI|nr:uncharacterized protein BDZ99DRAFT_203 [Mytilinidion resinicola]KAF2816723.1 hypothetical protein BDZ99DRAFT_203 [Mytilinidion resinicola]
MLMLLMDTAGQEDYDTLLPMFYSGADIVIICYPYNSTAGREEVYSRWVPEAKKKGIPFMLVGIENNGDRGEGYDAMKLRISFSALGSTLAKRVGAQSYVQCDLQQIKEVNKLFENVIMLQTTHPAGSLLISFLEVDMQIHVRFACKPYER